MTKIKKGRLSVLKWQEAPLKDLSVQEICLKSIREVESHER